MVMEAADVFLGESAHVYPKRPSDWGEHSGFDVTDDVKVWTVKSNPQTDGLPSLAPTMPQPGHGVRGELWRSGDPHRIDRST
jgi:hypothetical protein